MVVGTENQSSEWKFIETEPLGLKGEAGEQRVWDRLRQTFRQGEGVVLWSYNTFKKDQQFRKEPDILIVSRELGLIIIEVKSCGINDIEAIEGNRWKMSQRFHSDYLYPYRQAEKQLYVLLDHCNEKAELYKKIPGRVIVALPAITKSEWRNKGFNEQHHACPPILFRDDLGKINLFAYIRDTATIIQQGDVSLEDKEWKLLLREVLGVSPLPPILPPPVIPPSPRAKVIAELRNWISDIDWQQLEIGMQVPPGPQRIRGMAGSGKSILLCQKAARMHWRNLEMDIALVFFTRSLYGLIIELVDKWVRHFSGGEMYYDPKTSKLRVLHAWGAKEQPGLYSSICKASNIKTQNVNDFPNRLPNEALALACTELLNKSSIPQTYDAILIDEGQDLIVDKALKFEDKQPFYWMAYQALRPVDAATPEIRRLIWAYDEAQSLNSLVIPKSSEIFGSELSKMIGGAGGGIHKGGIKKAYIIRRCYRSPGCILVAAHAIGMGLLRPNGMLTGFTNKEDWRRIGYEVEGNFKKLGSTITLYRPQENSPNPVQQEWNEDLIEFNIYNSRTEEIKQLVDRVKHNLFDEGLNPSRDILVIALGSFQLQKQIAESLVANGINFYIPTATGNNSFPDSQRANLNKFWNERGVTVSGIHRAKGNEANIVYVVGLDNVAKNESNLIWRNQLFVAMTRARGWVSLSGIGKYSMYEEIRQVIESKGSLNFPFQPPVLDTGE
ncbi:ATP-binding domain-containing protein [Trichocoleus sp. FACHB-832]|uniref:ATP-binding domain-containing protein n=1 Tax=Trichocoleus sp. FACHB-832 TaxID=2692875 RepID=UPI001684DDFD|nr:nuclease-related domain-containing DEAD/DEAH box helicase [Trichocoleus sp. FACHB-832]MBD1906459.1 ATP-binding domain-containing protein [Trichocoleus sp. FACHB-832]